MIKIEERIYSFVSIYFYLKIFDNQRIIREKRTCEICMQILLSGQFNFYVEYFELKIIVH